jgi:hypothetical protein
MNSKREISVGSKVPCTLRANRGKSSSCFDFEKLMIWIPVRNIQYYADKVCLKVHRLLAGVLMCCHWGSCCRREIIGRFDPWSSASSIPIQMGGRLRTSLRYSDFHQKHMITSWPVTGIKYFAGHSDLFCGILVVRTEDERKQVFVIEFLNHLKLIFISSGTTVRTWEM